MRSTLAISVAALSAVHGVMAAPVTDITTDITATAVVETTEDLEAAILSVAELVKSATDAMVSGLPDDSAIPVEWIADGNYDLPPPIFDPPEPRPASIFGHHETGDFPEALPPPVISLSRPEVLSKFDAGNQPFMNPFPPDQASQQEGRALMHCAAWVQTLKLAVCFMALFFAAALLVKFIEVIFARLFSPRSSRRADGPPAILRVEPYFDDNEKQRPSHSSQPLSSLASLVVPSRSRSSSAVKEYEA